MDNQILIKLLGTWYTYISLPALAIAGIIFLRKFKSKGGAFLGYGSIAAALGSMFNKLLPWQTFLEGNPGELPTWVHTALNCGMIVHLIGLNILVVGIVLIAREIKDSKV